MKDRAGNELNVGDRVLYLQNGTSTSWLVWGTIDSFTPKLVRIIPEKKRFLEDTTLKEPKSVVIPKEPVEESHESPNAAH